MTLEPSVGGVARVPDAAGAPLAAQETSSGLSALFLVGVSAAALAAALILGRLLWRAMAGTGPP